MDLAPRGGKLLQHLLSPGNPVTAWCMVREAQAGAYQSLLDVDFFSPPASKQ